MIKKQIPYIDDGGIVYANHVKRYSDAGKEIINKKTGEIFAAPVDLLDEIRIQRGLSELELEYEEYTPPIADDKNHNVEEDYDENKVIDNN